MTRLDIRWLAGRGREKNALPRAISKSTKKRAGWKKTS